MMTVERLMNYVLLIALGVAVSAGLMMSGEEATGLNLPKKAVLVRQADNGYIVERRVADNPYNVGERVALTPEDAAKELLLYLNGPPPRPRYPELAGEKGGKSR